MILVGKEKNVKIPDKYELELFMFSLKYDRDNIARGHLEKISADYGVGIKWWAESKIFFDFVKRKKIPKRISLASEKINLKFIDSVLEKPLIVYIDRFYLWKKEHGLYFKYHFPHFVIVNRKIGNSYEIIDPDHGTVRKISSKKLSKSISGLRNHLWISPQAIQLSG